MITRIRGRILEKGPSHLVVDIAGVGLLVHVPVSSFDRFGREGEEVNLLTHLNVKEDALDLYGFASEGERRLFRMLLGVSGIGPRSALGILSGMNMDMLQTAILSGDVASLTRVPGVGKKTAQRIVVELKGPLSEGLEAVVVGGAVGGDDKLTNAVEALVALGLRRSDAYRSVARAIREMGEDASLEEIVRRGLGQTVRVPQSDAAEEAKTK
jgi:Holliday junction DNA helicase RuvA